MAPAIWAVSKHHKAKYKRGVAKNSNRKERNKLERQNRRLGRLRNV